MATSNIQIFNQYQNNALDDNSYTNCEERRNGFLGLLARANVFNKFCYQVSLVCSAIADFMVGRGYNAKDTNKSTFTQNFEDSIISVIADEINARVPNVRIKNTSYQKGDIATDASLPLWGELECITAGTTSDSDFSSVLPSTINAIGLQIQDGTAIWCLRAKRFSSPLNTPIPFNGQFVEHQVFESGIAKTYYIPIHHETGLEMIDYRYCDGQTVGGFSTIDMRNRFLMCKNSCGADNGEGGTDEVAIEKKHLPTDNFGLNLTCNDYNKTFDLKGTFDTTKNGGSHQHNAGTATTFAPGTIGGRIPDEGGNGTSSTNIDHTHKVTVEFKNINITHKHSISGTVKLNSNAQQKISVVSRHYKMGYIQRIY